MDFSSFRILDLSSGSADSKLWQTHLEQFAPPPLGYFIETGRGNTMRVRYIEFIAALALMTTPCQGQGISTVAGTGICCAHADGVAASAFLQGADGVTVDNVGNLYMWEVSPFRVRKVNTSDPAVQ
jgi:hypothetical protein